MNLKKFKFKIFGYFYLNYILRYNCINTRIIFSQISDIIKR